jgi:hypothetical protein
MEIGPHFIQKNGLFLDRFKTWDELFPISSDGSRSTHVKRGLITVILLLSALNYFNYLYF